MRSDRNDALWEQEGERGGIQPLSRRQGGLLLAVLAAVLLLAMLFIALFGLPNGPEDISFEYEALLKEVLLDEEGKVTALLTAPIGLNSNELLVYVDRSDKAVTATGKTSYKNLSEGTLLFLSVQEGTTLSNGTPPCIWADVIMVKDVG